MQTIATPYTPKTVSGRMFLRHAIDGDTDRTFYAHCLRHIRNEESSFAMRHAHAWLDWIGYPTKIRLGVTSAESTVQSLTVVESINQKFKVGDRVVYVFCDSDGNETIEYRGLTVSSVHYRGFNRADHIVALFDSSYGFVEGEAFSFRLA